MDNENKGIFPPEGGWLPNTWYACEVKMFLHNPKHRHLFFTGSLNGKNEQPGGYHGGFPVNYCPSHSAEDIYHLKDYYYLKALFPILNSKGEKLSPKVVYTTEAVDGFPAGGEER